MCTKNTIICHPYHPFELAVHIAMMACCCVDGIHGLYPYIIQVANENRKLCSMEIMPMTTHDQCTFRPAFFNTLFPVTRPHHIYSTALVIITVIDNLKYVIIFIYILGFFHGKFQKSPKMDLGVQVSESLGRLIVQTFTTDVSNHLQLIDFPMCTECKKEGQKPIKRLKTKD